MNIYKSRTAKYIKNNGQNRREKFNNNSWRFQYPPLTDDWNNQIESQQGHRVLEQHYQPAWPGGHLQTSNQGLENNHPFQVHTEHSPEEIICQGYKTSVQYI